VPETTWLEQDQAAELTPWNVIGRSLVDKLDDEQGIIEAIVKINS